MKKTIVNTVAALSLIAASSAFSHTVNITNFSIADNDVDLATSGVQVYQGDTMTFDASVNTWHAGHQYTSGFRVYQGSGTGGALLYSSPTWLSPSTGATIYRSFNDVVLSGALTNVLGSFTLTGYLYSAATRLASVTYSVIQKVPEPGTILLFGLGLLGLGLRAKQKKA